jgi:hypothetical protein
VSSGRGTGLGHGAGCRQCSPEIASRRTFVYLLTFPNISDAGILITIFNLAVIKTGFFYVVLLVIAFLRQI